MKRSQKPAEEHIGGTSEAAKKSIKISSEIVPLFTIINPTNLERIRKRPQAQGNPQPPRGHCDQWGRQSKKIWSSLMQHNIFPWCKGDREKGVSGREGRTSTQPIEGCEDLQSCSILRNLNLFGKHCNSLSIKFVKHCKHCNPLIIKIVNLRYLKIYKVENIRV